jgi:hypothetical protein
LALTSRSAREVSSSDSPIAVVFRSKSEAEIQTARAMVPAIQTAQESVNVFSFRALMNSATALEKFFSCADSVMAILLPKARALAKSSFSWAKPTATLLQPPLSFFSVTKSVMELGSVISFSLVSQLA